ncbi:MAG: sensor hybrid histidine kinase [Phycisphaerales bacterium]|nr:sensor hybrid histidine kinase [Phycisphaerales bacterium]
MSETSRRLKILLVEDHQDTAHALANLLAREAHRVRRVHTGGDALRAAAEQSFDLLISDLRLPDISGYEVMAELKRKYNLIGIAVSGMSAPADIERALAAGFSRYLVKPVKLETLREVVEQIAGGGSADATVPSPD